MRLADSIFASTTPIRTRWPAGLCVFHAGLLNADLLNPASQVQMRGAEHELIDMGKCALAMDGTHPLRGKKKHPVKKGKCSYDACPCPKFEPKRPQHRCGSCNNGRGAYYHPACFFATHRVTKG